MQSKIISIIRFLRVYSRKHHITTIDRFMKQIIMFNIPLLRKCGENMLYVRNRYDRDGKLIENPETYVPQYTEELIKVLNEIYARDILDLSNSQTKR